MDVDKLMRLEQDQHNDSRGTIKVASLQKQFSLSELESMFVVRVRYKQFREKSSILLKSKRTTPQGTPFCTRDTRGSA